MKDALESDPEQYKNFNDFFTRRLRRGARPLGASDILSPADGAISQFGLLENDLLVQAKNRFFSLSELLATNDPAEEKRYQGGAFITIYLSPRDYHRFHMPIDGKLISTRYVPGFLYSVNHSTANNIDKLYARNERYIANFLGRHCYFSMVAVGAMIVAGIETVWSGPVVSNDISSMEDENQFSESSIFLSKGEEAGFFKLGSTIILLFPKEILGWNENLYVGKRVKMGEPLADFS